MPSEFTIRVSVSDHDAADESVAVEGDSALLGSASHCDVRLGPDRVAPEQLRFAVHNGQLFAEVRATSPGVLLNQLPFHQGRLLPEAVLTIGKVEVRVSLERHALHDGKQGEARVRPTFVAASLLLAAVLVLAIYKLSRHDPAPLIPAAPALFADAKSPACPEQAPEAARAAARELASEADAKRERAPFLPEEGLAAVPLYRTAMACFERAGDAADARSLSARAEVLQRYVERDYRLHQVRVFLAQRRQDVAQLSHEARVLQRYLRDRGGPYSAWLDQVQREIEARPKKKQRGKG